MGYLFLSVALFFKEKITWKSVLGLSLIFVAMVIINF